MLPLVLLTNGIGKYNAAINAMNRLNKNTAAFNFAMRQVSGLGGDTDTNCAIVGGLIGAYLGLSKIPKAKI